MRRIRMNTASPCCSFSLGVSPPRFVKGIETEEVDGSNPFGPLINRWTPRPFLQSRFLSALQSTLVHRVLDA
jgi:hypothetical protein